MKMHPGNARKDQKWAVLSIPEVEGCWSLKKMEEHLGHYLWYAVLALNQEKRQFDNPLLLESSTHTNYNWLRIGKYPKNIATEPRRSYFTITKL